MNRGGTPSRQIAANFVLLSAGEFAAKFLAVLAFTQLGRVLGPNAYGILEFALATLIFFSIPVDLGLGVYGAREIARNPERCSSLTSEITAIRFGLAIISYVLLLLLLLIMPAPSATKSLIALLGLSLFCAPALLQWLFQGLEQMHWVALSSIIRQIAFAGFVFLFVRQEQSLVVAGAAECVAIASAAIFCVVVARTQLNARVSLPSWHFTVVLSHLREAGPIGMSEFAWAFLWYAPTVILGLFVTDASLGWFGASHRCLTSLHSFIFLYFFNLLPALSRCAAQPGENVLRFLHTSIGGVIWAGVFIALVGTLLSHEIVQLLYGPGFGSGAGVFAVLVWVVPVTLISGHFRYGLVAWNLGPQLLYSTAAAALTSVFASLLLIPVFGAMGAACALLLANVVHLVVPYWLFRRHAVEVSFRSRALRPLLAMSSAVAAFWCLAGAGVWTAAFGAALLYAFLGAMSERAQLNKLLFQARLLFQMKGAVAK